MSDEFYKLKETSKIFYPKYEFWVKENSANFPTSKIENGAFTMQEASALLFEFLEAITSALFKDQSRCRKQVSSGELRAIRKGLMGVQEAIIRIDHVDFVNKVDELIPRMRPLQSLYTTRMDGHRRRKIDDMDKILHEIQTFQEIITNTVNKAKSDSENLHNLIKSITEKNEKFDKLINENNQKTKSLEELHNNTIDRADGVGHYVDKIENILNGANEQKSKIDSFVNLIQEREEKITSQNVATEAYEEKLKDFSKKYDLNMEDAKKLIEEANEALNLSTARGLGKAFLTRQEKLEDKNVKITWLVMGGLAVACAVGIGIFIIFFGKDNIAISSIVARTLIMMIFIAVAVFCSKQYAKNRTLEEDYAYKVALVASYPGLAKEFEYAEDMRKEYVVKLLGEVLQDPQRARHDKESLIDSHPLMAELKKFMKKNETKTDEAKPN